MIITLLGFLLCGKSCVDDNERILWQEKEARIIKDSIRGEIEADYLAEEARFAAEISAMHKLQDLSDYLKIYSDRSIDSVFRQKAGEMIRDIFISGDTRLSFDNIRSKKKKGMALKDFLANGFDEESTYTEIIFDFIQVIDPLHRSGANLYEGKIACYQNLSFFTATDTLETPSQAITVKIYSSRTNKIFGNDTLHVWAVFLGDMEISNKHLQFPAN